MRAKGYKTVESETAELNKIQDYVAAAIESLSSSEILDGLMLKNVQLVSGLNTISHKLGRPLLGWLVVRKRANIDIWDSQDTNSQASKTLNLQSSGTVSIDLYVF